MNSTDVEIIIEDPATGERHSFTGATEAAAIAAAEDHFGVAEADAIEGQR